MIGRKKEIAELTELYESNEAQLIAMVDFQDKKSLSS